MKPLTAIDGYRDVAWELRAIGAMGDADAGCFKVPSPEDKKPLRIIASRGARSFGWDHVSVSRADRVPSWAEMEHVKRLLFHDFETAMQLHVPPSEHVNNHPNCLHLWRPTDRTIPLPPSILVGVKGLDYEQVRALVGKGAAA